MTNTPTPAHAYAGAPDPVGEAALVLDYAGRLLRDDLSQPEHREYLLRHAALTDRTHLLAIDTGQADTMLGKLRSTAVAAARELVRFDLRHGTDRGRHAIGSPLWGTDDDVTAYVRAEYLIWRNSGPAERAGADIRRYTTLGDDLIVMQNRLNRGEEVPLDERFDLARRKVAIFVEIEGTWGGVTAESVSNAKAELAALERTAADSTQSKEPPQ
ncbi:hypothetical protein KV557_24645 [Kitasatospora aureofaciens]|uniref:hypothetical protein n=1 Tax=Kitasatospora aureofaciens TaxID=1894 RepID=UPI001C46D786|nr:hypothetical protein [Kitasatospora aureofaciens]MBV6700254.1 hypothetical protein [Kitasatospora aureofaciens]